jgi:hypothetical protein
LSWKAANYVKELVTGITPAEKLLLFVLSDYHNTVKRICWPSLKTIAEEALMSERNASRLLESLERKGILHRVVGTGRGKTTCYRFVELDGKDDILASFSDVKADTKADRKGDKSNGVIRKEPVLEPVLEPVTSMRFTPPTREEVGAYCLERGNSVDPEHWMDHYTSNGWKVGRVPMKDWRAAVRQWERSRFGGTNGKPSTAEYLENEGRIARDFAARSGR